MRLSYMTPISPVLGDDLGHYLTRLKGQTFQPPIPNPIPCPFHNFCFKEPGLYKCQGIYGKQEIILRKPIKTMWDCPKGGKGAAAQSNVKLNEVYGDF